MLRYIDADALIADVIERYCSDCDKRKGIKRGKWRIIYDIGEAPCRACSVDDMKSEIDDAPTVDAVQVVRCKDCKWCDASDPMGTIWLSYRCKRVSRLFMEPDAFCSHGERREDAEL